MKNLKLISLMTSMVLLAGLVKAQTPFRYIGGSGNIAVELGLSNGGSNVPGILMDGTGGTGNRTYLIRQENNSLWFRQYQPDGSSRWANGKRLLEFNYDGDAVFSQNVDLTGESPIITIEGTGTGNYAGGYIDLSAQGANTAHKYARTWFINNRGTDGTNELVIQRRDHDGNWQGNLLKYEDEKGFEFKVAPNHTTGSSLTSAMIISGNGNVGIGKGNPEEKLHIDGDIKLEKSDNKLYWDWEGRYIGQQSIGDSRLMVFRNSMNDSNPDGGFAFRNQDDVSILRINNDRVGIYNTSPEERLHINGNARVDGLLKISSDTKMEATDNGTYIVTAKDDIKFRAGDSPTTNLLIDENGRVGINTVNTSGYELAVNGKIRAKEIVCETGWSDFVFEENYDLPTLEEVEAHIKEKGHLKDIPSAVEVEGNGVALAEVSSKLLQKIEELTLYTIAQEKEIKHLKVENTQLKTMNAQIIELQARLSALETEK